MRILVVDDEQFVAQGTSLVLRRAGHEVTCANSGTDGLAKARAEQFDLVLSDVQMPGMSGVDMVKALRSHDPETPIWLTSGDTGPFGDKVRHLIEARQIAGFLPKPVHPDRLRAIATAT